MKTLNLKSSALLMLLALIPACGTQLVQFNQKVKEVAPAVTATLPANGAKGAALNTSIFATFSKAMDVDTISAKTFNLKQGTSSVPGKVSYTASTQTAKFTPDANLDTALKYTATITVGAKDKNGVALKANYTWSFTTTGDSDINAAPTVVSTTPLDDAVNVSINRHPTATFSKVMDPATLNTLTFTMQQGANPVTGTVSLDGASNTATFTPDVALGLDKLYTVTISTGAKDSSGLALASAYVWTFTTADSAVAPVIVSTSPLSNATNVSVNKQPSATFSRTMDDTTIDQTTFTLTQGVTPIAGTVLLDGATNTATFTPTGGPLGFGLAFTAQVSTGVRSSAGTAMAANYSWTFTTAVAADVTSPTITLTNPVNAATNVALNQTIKATFSEDMMLSTMNTTIFTVRETVSSLAVTGSIAYDLQNNIATFSPTSGLKANLNYTVFITTGAKDLAGNALVAGSRPNPWTFTTVAVDIIKPAITFTSPASGATNVALNSFISATFSEAMDPSKMIAANFQVTHTTLATVVTGSVTYDVQNKIATFIPGSALSPATGYTVTVTNVTDLAGNPLVFPSLNVMVPNPWAFTTATVQQPLAINLRGIETFGIASRAGMTSTGVTVINGDVALYPTPTCTDSTGNAGASQTCLVKTYSSPTGLTVNGSIYWAGDPHDNGGTANSATNDLTIAWNEGMNKLDTLTVAADELGGKIFNAGIYENANLTLMAGGIATMDAQNDANAIFIFKVTLGGDLIDSGTLLLPSSIVLINGAQARNVWFVVGRDITIGSGTTWKGNILAGRDATVLDGSTVTGRVLGGASGAGAIVLTGAASPSVTTITVPE